MPSSDYLRALEAGDAARVEALLRAQPELLTAALNSSEQRTFDVLARKGDWKTAVALLTAGYAFHPEDPYSPLQEAWKFDRPDFLLQVMPLAPSRDLGLLLETVFPMSLAPHRSDETMREGTPVVRALGDDAVRRLRAGDESVLRGWALRTALTCSIKHFEMFRDVYPSEWRATCGRAWLYHGARLLEADLLELGLALGAGANDDYVEADYLGEDGRKIAMTPLAAVVVYCGSRKEALPFAKRLLKLGADPKKSFDWEDDRYFEKGGDLMKTAVREGATPGLIRLLRGPGRWARIIGRLGARG